VPVEVRDRHPRRRPAARDGATLRVLKMGNFSEQVWGDSDERRQGRALPRAKVTDSPTFTAVVLNPGHPERSPFQNALCTYADLGSPPTKLSSSPHANVTDVSTSVSSARRGLQLATEQV